MSEYVWLSKALLIFREVSCQQVHLKWYIAQRKYSFAIALAICKSDFIFLWITDSFTKQTKSTNFEKQGTSTL